MVLKLPQIKNQKFCYFPSDLGGSVVFCVLHIFNPIRNRVKEWGNTIAYNLSLKLKRMNFGILQGVRKGRSHRIWLKLDWFLAWDSSKKPHNNHKISSVNIGARYISLSFFSIFSTFTWRRNLAHRKLLAFYTWSKRGLKAHFLIFGHFYKFKTFNKQWNVVHEANYDFGNSKQWPGTHFVAE